MKKYIDTGIYKMTNDEIKEALNCCRRYDSVDCLKCPLIKNKGYGCRYKLLSYASILITKQEREIERLEDIDMIIKEQKDDRKFDIKQAKIDVLNKLRRITWQGYQIGMYIVSTQEIDELIKDIENEN